jgi:hypothetical protein
MPTSIPPPFPREIRSFYPLRCWAAKVGVLFCIFDYAECGKEKRGRNGIGYEGRAEKWLQQVTVCVGDEPFFSSPLRKCGDGRWSGDIKISVAARSSSFDNGLRWLTRIGQALSLRLPLAFLQAGQSLRWLLYAC